MIRNLARWTGTAALLAAGVTACTPASAPAPAHPAPSPRAAAMAYMRAHPLTAAAGMAAGVMLTSHETGFVGTAGTPETRCPVRLTAAVFGQGGPLCGAWSGTALTPAGNTVTLTCGNAQTGQPCPLLLVTADQHLIPYAGDYVRFAAGGQVTRPANIQVVTSFAVPQIPEGNEFAWVPAPSSSVSSVLQVGSARTGAAYARTHPVPARPGTVPAVITGTAEAWTSAAVAVIIARKYPDTRAKAVRLGR
jgi:hypothetical protein